MCAKCCVFRKIIFDSVYKHVEYMFNAEIIREDSMYVISHAGGSRIWLFYFCKITPRHFVHVRLNVKLLQLRNESMFFVQYEFT